MKSKLALLCVLLLPLTAHAQVGGSIFIEELTWVEVRDRIAQGATIALVPVGGTEQSGPHMANGAHNSIMRYAAGEIARKTGSVLVAPLIPYGVSGRISPPEGNMAFPGTLSLRGDTLAMILEDTATSLKQHGFRLICFIGDTPGSQYVLQQTAAKLNGQWSAEGVQVLFVDSYAQTEPQREWAMGNGAMAKNPMAHAGMVETSQLMAVASQQVRTSQIAAYGEGDFASAGASGDATQSNATFGRGILGIKISAAVSQIRQAAGKTE